MNIFLNPERGTSIKLTSNPFLLGNSCKQTRIEVSLRKHTYELGLRKDVGRLISLDLRASTCWNITP